MKPQNTERNERSEGLVAPHGGTLVDRIVLPDRAAALADSLSALPRLTLDARELADLELIAVGAASPLQGFLNEGDYRGVLKNARLTNGTVWPLPFTLAIEEASLPRIKVGMDVALGDATGRLWGKLAVESLFRRDPDEEATAICGTTDTRHPGVAYLHARPPMLVGGAVTVLPLPDDLPFADLRLTPRQLRERIRQLGWKRVAGFQTRNPIHRAHEHLTKLALELADGLVIHPLVGDTKEDDVPAAVRVQAYRKLIDGYYPSARTILAAFPAAMRYAGPREALMHAVIRKNYGITDLIIGRDHAGVGGFYDPLAAQRIFDDFGPEAIGVTPLRFDPAFYCKACGNMASTRTCPHDASARLELSGTKVREILRTGGQLPGEFTRPEVAEVLRRHYQGGETVVGAVSSGNQGTGGILVWFTGLSGAGKSTLAQAVRAELLPSRSVELLDGDEVRTFLSKGLGFSKEDRDTNIRRIGYVARMLARHKVVVLAAAISPYAEIRDEIRSLANREGTRFVEIYVLAAMETLIQRDTKGLYRKALAGEIPNFTGVSDPYEPPPRAELVINTGEEDLATSVHRIMTAIRAG